MLSNLMSNYFFDTVEPIAKWISIGVIGTMILSLIVLFFNKKETYTKSEVAKTFGSVAVVYALVMGIFLVVLEILKKFSGGYLEENWVSSKIVGFVFIPVLVTLLLTLIGLIALFIIGKKKPEATKKVSLIVFAVCAVALVITIVLIAIFYAQNIVGDGYYTGDYGKLNSPLLYTFAGLLVLIVVATAFIVGKNNKKPFDSKCIAFAGVSVALSFVLSYVKFEGAWLQGGSITLVSFLPICLFSYIYGMKKGLVVGFVYGLLQAIQDPFIVHPAQFMLDYPIAFSMIALSGLLTDLNLLSDKPMLKFTIGVLLTGTFRYIAHVISGVFAFGAYAMDEGATSFLTYSAVYNTYVFIDIALVVVVGLILLSSKAFRKELDK
ncbi:MAG: energy-coupled thiamine transporter ThiT [Clostridiales bacterium]|nr:energy-coupled thiamine transporter ThiT [Clostridiales bacterium]